MGRILTVCPCLHPVYLRLRLVGADCIYQHVQPWFVRVSQTAEMTRLLKRYHVIRPVTERFAQRDRVLDNPRLEMRDAGLTPFCHTAMVGTYTVGINRRVGLQKSRMLLQRTAAVIQIMHLYLHALGVTERHQLLFHCVPGETVANAQHTEG